MPAWGFARAVESRCGELPEATRIFGYVPMGGEFVLTPRSVDERAVRDASAHRADLPAAYNAYRRAEPGAFDDATMVLQPPSSPRCCSREASSGHHASSSRAPRARRRSRRPTCCGGARTPGRRADHVRRLRLELGRLRRGPRVRRRRTARASAEHVRRLCRERAIRAAVHRHLGDALDASIVIGATHVDAGGDAGLLPGPRPTFFFAPDHLGAGLDADALDTFRELLAWSASWLEARTSGRARGGPRSVGRSGRGAPAAGHGAVARPLSRRSVVPALRAGAGEPPGLDQTDPQFPGAGSADARTVRRARGGNGPGGGLPTTVGVQPASHRVHALRRWTVWSLVGLVAAAGVGVAVDRAFFSGEARYSWPPEPCVVDGVDARCGTFVVPENRTKPNGHAIGLHVVVLPSFLKPARSNAVTYIEGGPGGAAQMTWRHGSSS